MFFKYIKEDNNITFLYDGKVINENVDSNKKEKNLKQIIEHKINNHDLDEIIKCLRTALKDYDEELLHIDFLTEDSKYSITYENKNLISYDDLKIVSFGRDSYKMHYKYNKNSGTNFKFMNLSDELVNVKNIHEMRKMIDEESNLVEDLLDISSYELTECDKALICAYENFYKEKPDFSATDIDAKVQTMVYILSKYGINLPSQGEEKTYYFSLSSKKNKYPESTMLKQVTRNLIPYCDDVDIYNVLDKDQKLIKVIGSEIDKAAKDYSEGKVLKVLKELCLVDYVDRMLVNGKVDYETLSDSEYIKCSPRKIKKLKELITTIDGECKYQKR